ncbi:hypothetical protein BOX15_Mlig002126g1 [Macrostomum lignano]|uniref:Uncharacterized protein n=1 Tax=Macrostomum lignano TaxID=282301 RepID=A0A267DPD0_9PLAT|nr:hypothetical protein BOX15_Mlig002126g2 [Macrostomum lignano]PAA62017.1 hypothetical protein BOX15_Mlig002126g1 [Macrostomum lignano]
MASSSTVKGQVQVATVNRGIHGCNILPEINKKENQNQHNFAALLKAMQSEDNKVNLLGIGQTHWMGEGMFRINESRDQGTTTEQQNSSDYLVAHCGNSDTAYRGVAIVVRGDELQKSVLNFDFVSSRIIGVDLNCTEGFGTVVQVFAPRQKNVKLEHDTFWKQLKSFLTSKFNAGSQWIIVMGDFDVNDIGFPQSKLSAPDVRINKFEKGEKNFILLLSQTTTDTRIPNSKNTGKYLYDRSVQASLELNCTCKNEDDPAVATKFEYELFSDPKIEWPFAASYNNQPAASHVSIYAAVDSGVKRLTASTEILRHMQKLCTQCFDPKALTNGFSASFTEDILKADPTTPENALCIHLCLDAFQCATPQTVGVEFFVLKNAHYTGHLTISRFLQEIKDKFLQALRALDQSHIYWYWGGMLIGKNLKYDNHAVEP